MFALLLQVSEMVEGVDYGGVQRVVLLRRRAPEQERIEVEGNVFIEKWDGEIGLGLGEENAVVVCEPRANERHGLIVGYCMGHSPLSLRFLETEGGDVRGATALS